MYDATVYITTREKQEWRRMADAAEKIGRHEVAQAFRESANADPYFRLPIAEYDYIMSQYRAWLCFNEYPADMTPAPRA